MSRLQEAFAGLNKTIRGDKEPQSQHSQFIQNDLLPLTTKLQREVRGRRCKDVQKKLQEAILLIRPFQNEDWPPKKGIPPTSIDTSSTLNDANNKLPDDLDDNDTSDPTVVDSESVAGDYYEDDRCPSIHPAAEALGTITDDDQSIRPQNPVEEDPQSQDPVHVSIVCLVETLILLMNNPAKTNRACDLSLQIISLVVDKRYLSGVAGGQGDNSASGPHESEGQGSLIHRVLEGVAKVSESNNELIYGPVIDTLKNLMTSPKCGIHEASMLLALRTTFHVYLVTKSETCKSSAKMALVDMLRSVFSRMEAYEAVAKRQIQRPASTSHLSTPKSEQSSEGSVSTASFVSQYHTDSYVLFRALCKLSSKDLPVDRENETSNRLFNTQATTDPLALNSKILSLELILASLDFCGEAFCEGERFIHLVQHYLCSSLLKNCMSEHSQIAFISQKIFLVLVYKFKAHLKQEIEVFLSNVFLKVLDSPNSSFKQKAVVLESLRSLSNDASLLSQLFLNYDCDLHEKNLYKEIIHMLTKLAGKATSAPSSSVSRKDSEGEFELSLAAIEVLVTTMKAMLRALGLPGGEDSSEDSAGAKIRGMLSIDVSGSASKPDEPKDGASAATESLTDDISYSERISTAVGDFEEIGSSDVAGQIVDAYELKRNAEQNFEIGSVKFTLSLKGGLTFFIENGLVQLDAREIALFFIANKDKLDKTQMGEALGREPHAGFVKDEGVEPDKGGIGFWVRILHHFVDALDFTGLMFDEAIRLFLSGFRLPGEAQKIDRIMEKFAEKFTSQNPDIFPSADTAFILAFSVIMLNTDLHNPSIKPERRMTLDSFVRNNRGIGDNGSDLPREFLEGIFNRIKERPFSLKEDDDARERVAQKQISDSLVFFESPSLFGTTVEQRKRETFKKEKDELMAQTERLIRRRPEKNTRATGSSTNLDSVAPSDVIRPMFDVTWGPLLGILSQVLECSDDERSIAVCLSGFVYAVRIAAHGRMSLARDTFVSSLAKFTFLGSIKEMKRKNIESVRTLLSIAIIDGEYLAECWGPVLQCMSQLARLRLSASGLDSDESFLGKQKKMPSTPARADFDLFRPSSRLDIARDAEELNGKAILEAVHESLMDKVFSSTVNLSAHSLARFIEQLIAVSRSEIAGNSKSVITGIESGRSKNSSHGNDGPSIFSLQRLVDVADYNMDSRPRLVWAQVWEVLADFFAEIACHENALISVFAIDSLKQLSFKFLEKPELKEFNFQRLFLKPFLVVMEDKGSRIEVREMVLQCVSNIVMTKSHNLRSGWKVVFSILDHSAGDANPKIESLGMGILQRLLDEHLTELCNISDEEEHSLDASHTLTSSERRDRNSNVEDFVGLCRASLAFVGKEGTGTPRPIGLSLRAFCHTAIYADLLASKRVLPAVSGAQSEDPDAPGYTYEGLDEQDSLEMVAWRPLLEGLARWVRSPKTDGAGGVGCLLQRGSILALRAILLRHGSIFSSPQLKAILTQTLIPAIQAGAESDQSPVLNISSESPFVSSIDFLAEPPPLPPAVDDNRLRLFESNMNSSSKRKLGPAELMLEASFTDLRHGGDGDLCRAYQLAKKEERTSRPALDEPFPNSWLATTAPSALGLLTDIVSELVVPRGVKGSKGVWPDIARLYQIWCVGHTGGFHGNAKSRWNPCEAVVRVSCREMQRFSTRLAGMFVKMEKADATTWASLVLELFAGVIRENVKIENGVRDGLLSRRREYLGRGQTDSTRSHLNTQGEIRNTPFGRGRLLKVRHEGFDGSGELVTNVIKLNFGGTLYLPETVYNGERAYSDALKPKRTSSSVLDESLSGNADYLQNGVPALKIRVIALHLLHQSLCFMLDLFVTHVPKLVLSDMIDALNQSRISAERSVLEQDVAVAFQEALLNDWGHGVDEMQEAIEGSSHLRGSAMFFLTQEAGATQATIRMLSILYKGFDDTVEREKWDREAFAEPYLYAVFHDVMTKFVASEKRDSHRIPPNVWRNASESGGKVAFYCTSFAAVIVEILSILKSMREDQFRKHIKVMFCWLCDLVCVQSDEIRHLVKDVMEKQVLSAISEGQDI
ncbi:hypothetical protein ACA910_017516 [Epithemia clementina (nom. ined.)]